MNCALPANFIHGQFVDWALETPILQGQERARWRLAVADRGGIRSCHDHALLDRKLAPWTGCGRRTASICAVGPERRLDTRKN